MASLNEHPVEHSRVDLTSRFFHSKRDKHIVKVLPGGIYATRKTDELIATGLGSCIAACVWDEKNSIGGMNHFLLPFDTQTQIRSWHPDQVLSTAARYGSHAMEVLINTLLGSGAYRENLQVKLFGGAQMLGRNSMIGEKNIEFILNYVEQEQLKVVATDLGGLEPRKVMFEPTTGRAWIKRIPFTEMTKLRNQEDKYAHQLDRESHGGNDTEVELF